MNDWFGAEESLKEIIRYYPKADVTTELRGDRGIITVCQDRFVLSKEFVETEQSLCSPHCMSEYGRILRGKARLVLIVPKEMCGQGQDEIVRVQ